MSLPSTALSVPSLRRNRFRFINLPAEIRELVYEYTLVSNEPIILTYDGLNKRVELVYDEEVPNFEPSGLITTTHSVAWK
jgi:hypothetical protein